MALRGLIYKQRTFPDGRTGVVYWIADGATDTVKECIPLPKGLLAKDVNPDTYLTDNLQVMYDASEATIDDGKRRFQQLSNKNETLTYQNALHAGIQALRNGGDLADMNSAIQAVYIASGLNQSLLMDFYTAYSSATDNQRYQFNIAMFITFDGLINRVENGD